MSFWEYCGQWKEKFRKCFNFILGFGTISGNLAVAGFELEGVKWHIEGTSKNFLDFRASLPVCVSVRLCVCPSVCEQQNWIPDWILVCAWGYIYVRVCSYGCDPRCDCGCTCVCVRLCMWKRNRRWRIDDEDGDDWERGEEEGDGVASVRFRVQTESCKIFKKWLESQGIGMSSPGCFIF